jgi:hypothetical protein
MSDLATRALFAPIAVAPRPSVGEGSRTLRGNGRDGVSGGISDADWASRQPLVYGPVRYQFADFVKVGTPLTVICALVVVLLAPLISQG